MTEKNLFSEEFIHDERKKLEYQLKEQQIDVWHHTKLQEAFQKHLNDLNKDPNNYLKNRENSLFKDTMKCTRKWNEKIYNLMKTKPDSLIPKR